MENNFVLKVENLTKKYIINHKKNDRYVSLRDKINESITGLKNRFTNPFANNFKINEEFLALNDLSFVIEKGDTIGIVGKNGAGKSTLLKVLSQITPPSSGRAMINGRVASLLEVGTGFHPELTGRENIYLNGSIIGMKRREIDRKFDEIVDFSGVEFFLDTPVKRFSSGMYARLAFAVAAHLDSELLIIDEVLAVGDSDFQKKCISKMESVSKNEGKTLLFVSHNIASIKNLCNKSILLEKGKLINYDFTETIVDQYEKSFVINSTFEKKNIKNLGLIITDLKINSLLGGKVEPFKPVLIEIEIESFVETDEYAVEVLITNHLTTGLIFATNIKQHKNKKLFLKVGINKISLRISEFLLCSGQYNLGIGINIPFVEQLFTDFNILTFNVNEIIIGDGRLSSLPAYGQVYLDHEWITD